MARLYGGRAFLAAAAVLVAAAAAPTAAARSPLAPDRVEVVVGLADPPLAAAHASSRALSARARTARLDLDSSFSTAYVRRLQAAQRALARRIAAALPTARVRWRYQVVANGMAVVVDRTDLPRLARLPGAAQVYPNVRYRALLDDSPELIGAPTLWTPNLSMAGQGMKIGVIDDGVDQSHRFFSPAGYTMPPGFPKGEREFATAKVIVARAFPPPSPAWTHAAKPFDPEFSVHGTHVAGIAAGNHRLPTPRAPISGVAPRAYIGNYKVLTIPTVSGVGLDGNAPEIVAGIEAAVRDGMDVINLSLGEPEIEPRRDLVVLAIGAAVKAGVVAAIAAGNDYDEFGRGSIGSPGSTPEAISVAAATKDGTIASFSSAGPTPISLQLKPDVAAPGANILSSVPEDEGRFAEFSGTSMAAPHVAGGAALLLQRHPKWTPAQVKSALAQTGRRVNADSGREALTTREGGGMIDLPLSNDPLVFAAPVGLSFGLVQPGATATRRVTISDAGGGSGDWLVQVAPQTPSKQIVVTAPSTVFVPGRITLQLAVAANAPEREFSGFLVLRLADQTRRIPYWGRVVVPDLARVPHGTLTTTGTYSGNTRGKRSVVTEYRYPEVPGEILRGPEHAFRVVVRGRVANFGVAIVQKQPSVLVSPRIVVAGDENRLAGYTALPRNFNPYQRIFGIAQLVSAAIRPAPGAYDVVFDSRSAATAGAFRFRFWINDVTPPRVKVLVPAVVDGKLRIDVSDAGSGIDPKSLVALIDDQDAPIAYSARTGRVLVTVGKLDRGRHQFSFQVSDFQETKNMENVPRILPNTTEIRRTLVVE